MTVDYRKQRRFTRYCRFCERPVPRGRRCLCGRKACERRANVEKQRKKLGKGK